MSIDKKHTKRSTFRYHLCVCMFAETLSTKNSCVLTVIWHGKAKSIVDWSTHSRITYSMKISGKRSAARKKTYGRTGGSM